VNQTTREEEYTTESSLYLAFELGKEKWKLGFSTGLGQKPRLRTIEAGDLAAFEDEVRLSKPVFDT
jgi:hypothetical protein